MSAATPAAHVYVFRNAANSVLYVGCTSQFHLRLGAHARTKEWYGEIASIELRPYGSEDEAFAAESSAIRDLRPIYENSSLSRQLRGAGPKRLPCRRCRRGHHHECLTVNRLGEPCPCSVCARERSAA